MCQKSEGERQYVFAMERAERKKRLEAHESGEQPLTQEEIQDLAIKELMARDAGF